LAAGNPDWKGGRNVVLYATKWEQAWYDANDELFEEERLVVVEADSPGEAAEKTGLVVEQFHPATDEELEEWAGLVSAPLSERDYRMLLSLIAADLREIRRKRRRDRATGRWPRGSDDAFDVNRARAFRLLCMGAKLDLALEDADDEGGYNEDNKSAASAARKGVEDVAIHD
jgi:hypothetical protein